MFANVDDGFEVSLFIEFELKRTTWANFLQKNEITAFDEVMK